MGANEKHAATYHGGEYVPDEKQLRHAYLNVFTGERNETSNAEFDRGIAKIRAEAKAEALDEASREIDRLDSDVEMYDENLNARQVSHWLRAHAEQYKEQS